MTDMAGDSDSQLLRTDALGRVFIPAERRERLLDEFEHSGASGLKFARLDMNRPVCKSQQCYPR
ncbi:MAG: hypothetical protein ABI847_21370 [Anaerolineales bacterium]